MKVFGILIRVSGQIAIDIQKKHNVFILTL
jgi:hypothetical protein